MGWGKPGWPPIKGLDLGSGPQILECCLSWGSMSDPCVGTLAWQLDALPGQCPLVVAERTKSCLLRPPF